MNNLSMLICVYDEEKTIANKIENLLQNDKNSQIGEIIVIDDNSSDRTFEIAQRYVSDKVKLIKNSHKKGKWGALVTGFEHAEGEIIGLTDADVMFEENTICEALKLFSNPLVGAVTSSQKTIPKSAYEGFRNFFRKLESNIDSTSAFHGQCMFFRKKYLKLTPSNLTADDLDIAIRIRRAGYRTLFADKSYYIEKIAVPYDEVSEGIFRRRAKGVVQAMMKNMDILFNFRYRKFGLICFPIEFFINIILPFLAIGLLVINQQWFKMAYYQTSAVVNYLQNPEDIYLRWKTKR